MRYCPTFWQALVQPFDGKVSRSRSRPDGGPSGELSSNALRDRHQELLDALAADGDRIVDLNLRRWIE
jgi:hypothetical protein